MAKLSLTEARAQLPSLIERVARGETIVITRRGEAVAKLARYSEANKKPLLRGTRVELSDDFDAPMPELWDALK